MNRAEAVMLVGYVRAFCPQQKFDEYTPDAWHAVLQGFDVADAQAAVLAHITAGNAFVAVGEIITGIRRIRAERIAAANLVYDGDPDESPIESGASLRQLVQRAGDGAIQPRPILAALEPAARDGRPTSGRARAALAAVGQAIPSPRAGVVNVLAIGCPHCHAIPGRPCTSGYKRKRTRADAHPARLEDARRAAAGLPPAAREEAEQEMRRRIAASQAALAALPNEELDHLDHLDQSAEAS